MFTYRRVLTLAIILAALDASFLAFTFVRSPSLVALALYYFATAMLTLLGTWLQSYIFRYLGAALLALWTGGIFWPLFTRTRIVWSVEVGFLIAIGVAGGVMALILLFSRKFSSEFRIERDRQPPFKAILRKTVFTILIIAATVATLNDIYHLASSK